uniref:HAT C-terminal dimerisation domain-containing protein n=1 Tax=Bracon brevicornis TaxID=1563983 RepID=A0A6V7JZC7_9HYME
MAHRETSKHKHSVKTDEIVNTLPKLDSFTKITLSQKRKIAELKTATYVAEHCSINAVDHLSLLIKGLDKQSEVLQDIKLGRTKCAALIKNVLSPCILEDLLTDVGDSFFSLIIDESTTIDTKKLLCVMIRYFSRVKKRVITTFYRMIEMKAGTADAISNAILDQLKLDNLSHDKLLGLGVDGANTNVGAHHSVSTILRAISPDLVVIKCLCHSLHLAAEEACKVFPRHLDFMVRETHSWFSMSTKRQIEYADLYRTLEGKTPKKIVKLSNTRWLVRLQAVDAILDQWDALQLHFKMTESNNERCYVALQLHGMYSTPENKIYLQFLSSTLKSIIGLNRLFQSSSADPVKLFQDLNDAVYSILQMIIVPSQLAKVPKYGLAKFDFKQFCMSTDCIHFGYEFNESISKINPQSAAEMKQRCKDFLVVLVSQIQKRIPENIDILERMTTFSPQSSSSQVKPDITAIASRFKHGLCTEIDSTIKEWNLVHRAEITNKSSTESFWAEVNEITDAGGNKKFGNISKLVLGLLSLPFSNAAVERAFSIVNIIKDKLRNRMSTGMVEAILHVRCTLDAECCKFEPTAAMLKRFNSETVYSMVGEDDIVVMNTLSTDEIESS